MLRHAFSTIFQISICLPFLLDTTQFKHLKRECYIRGLYKKYRTFDRQKYNYLFWHL